jgi:cytoskeletal protein RodZ
MNISRTENENHPDSFGISSVGAWLKVAREERGFTLDEVAKVTRIGKTYLEAIEEGDLGKLPSQAYTRGFIRLYAAHLGLSPEKATAMMEVSPAASAETSPVPPSHQKKVRNPLSAYSRSLTGIAILTLALVSGYHLLKPTKESSTPVQSSQVEPRPADQTLKTVTTQQEQSSPPINEPAPSPPSEQKPGENQGIVLRLKAVSDGKIHITIDGSVSQEYDLVTGDLVEWKAEHAFLLDLENAASVEGDLDGVKLDPFGEPGRAAHLVLKADGIHKD